MQLFRPSRAPSYAHKTHRSDEDRGTLPDFLAWAVWRCSRCACRGCRTTPSHCLPPFFFAKAKCPALIATGMERYEQEVQLETIFQSLSDGFKRLDKLPEGMQQALMKDLTAQMQEAKT